MLMVRKAIKIITTTVIIEIVIILEVIIKKCNSIKISNP